MAIISQDIRDNQECEGRISNFLEPSLESVGKESSSRQGNRQPAAAKHDH